MKNKTFICFICRFNLKESYSKYFPFIGILNCIIRNLLRQYLCLVSCYYHVPKKCMFACQITDIRIKRRTWWNFLEMWKDTFFHLQVCQCWMVYLTHISLCCFIGACICICSDTLNQICGLCMFLLCFYYFHSAIYLCSLPANRVIVRKLKIKLTYFGSNYLCLYIRRTILLEVNKIRGDIQDNALMGIPYEWGCKLNLTDN